MLTLVPTPIGNLGDITLRAIEVLKSADFILAEDTRVSGRLLQHLGLKKTMHSFHANNEHKNLELVLGRLQNGENAAMISDAGTPGISDPGFLLVRACVEQNIEIQTLPGPTAFVPALVQSGLPCDRFVFEGFLPVKKGRKTRLEYLREENRTMVFYESPHRILKTLKEFGEVFDLGRRVSVSREISKLHEETVRGSIQEVLSYFEGKSIKGEFVIVLAGS